MIRLATLVGTVLLLIGRTCSAAVAAEEAGKDPVGSWQWSEIAADVLASVEVTPAPYRASVCNTVGDKAGLEVRVGDGTKHIYSWPAHRHTVFAMADGVLYTTRFAPESSGCTVAAINLTTARVLWERRLTALGPVEHSKYRNRVNLVVRDATVIVYGNETAGRYIEAVDARTGALIRHHALQGERVGR